MESLNTLRAVLVGGAVLAAVLAAVYDYWLTAGILAGAIVAHALLWRQLWARRRDTNHP